MRYIFVVLLLVASAFAQHSVTLAWVKSPTVSVTGYNVKRSITAGGPYTQVGTTGITIPLQFVDNSPPVQIDGAKFYYVVTATSPGGESIPSNEVIAVIPFPTPGPPSGLTATPQ